MAEVAEKLDVAVEQIFIPIGYHLIVEPVKVEERTKGGLYIPETAREKEQKAAIVGRVLAVGSGCFDYDKSGTTKIEVGDKVVFARYGGMELPDINMDGNTLRALNDQDLVAKVVEKQ